MRALDLDRRVTLVQRGRDVRPHRSGAATRSPIGRSLIRGVPSMVEAVASVAAAVTKRAVVPASGIERHQGRATPPVHPLDQPWVLIVRNIHPQGFETATHRNRVVAAQRSGQSEVPPARATTSSARLVMLFDPGGGP